MNPLDAVEHALPPSSQGRGNPSLSPIRSAMLTALLSAASSFEPMLSLIALKAFAAWLFSLPVAFHRGFAGASRRAADGFRGVHVVLHGLTDVREGRLRVAREVVPPVRHGIDRALREVPRRLFSDRSKRSKLRF